tara:strand:+ start:566 stop:1300 length:735 start_codon:yes stop_codon:yes gene_type:complete
MSKEDILLRETINPPLTTKGSQFLFSELDANWIEVYNQFVLLSQSSQVAAYSAAITYSTGEYVSYSSQLWKMVSGTPQINITPGTDPTVWIEVYASDLVQAPVIGGATILTKEVTITTAEILTLNGSTTIIELIPSPGAGKYIDLIHITNNLVFNSVYYQGSTSLSLGYSTILSIPGTTLWQLSQGLGAEVTQIRPYILANTVYSSTNPYIVAADSVSVAAVGGSPTLGDSDIKINLVYQILDL